MQKNLSLMVVMIQILILKETSLTGEFGIKINQNEYSGSPYCDIVIFLFFLIPVKPLIKLVEGD